MECNCGLEQQDVVAGTIIGQQQRLEIGGLIQDLGIDGRERVFGLDMNELFVVGARCPL